jgi:hypothetical protein
VTITTTPKRGWRDTDVVAPLAEVLGVPIALVPTLMGRKPDYLTGFRPINI